MTVYKYSGEGDYDNFELVLEAFEEVLLSIVPIYLQ